MAQTEFAANGLGHAPLTIDAGLHDDDEDAMNGTGEGPDGELSPTSLRRSTRASALKAQERLKIKEGVDGLPARSGSRASDMDEPEDLSGVENLSLPKDGLKKTPIKEEKEESEESAAKRRKLYDGTALDQFRHSFGIKIEDGNVYELSDGSEISSLHESEVDALRKSYEKLVAKELTEEQRQERLRLVRAAENELRHEEAKLTMLKRIKLSQQMPNPATAAKIQEAAKKLAGIGSNTNGTAYKPAVAAPINKSINGKTSSTGNAGVSSLGANFLQALAKNPVMALASLNPQQQAELQRAAQVNPLILQALLAAATKSGTTGLNQQQINALTALLAQQQQAQQAQQTQSHTTTASAAAAAATPQSTPATSAQTASQKAFSQQTPQQRMATARLAFRKQADMQLMQIPAPKAPPCDFTFIPNGAQPDFCYLLGLDLAVQKVLKDKNVNKAVSELPYECEECGTDYTPSWKAIGGDSGDENDLHLYCEGCVRAAQKKKIRQDHQSLLKKAYTKINAQEKEFEKAIADGKLDQVLSAHLAANAAPSTSTSTPTMSASNSSANLASLAAASNSNSPAAALAAAAAAAGGLPHNLSTKSGVGIASTSAASASAIAAAASALKNSSSSTPVRTSQSNSSSKTTPATSSSTSSGQKRSSSSNSSSTQAQMAQFQQLQQFARMAAQSNPMMAAMMGPNSANAAAIFNTMQMNFMAVQAAQAAQAQAAQARNYPSSAMTNMANMAAMAAMAQAVQQGAGSSSNQMAQFAAAMNPAALQSMLANMAQSNPQFMNSLRQMNAGRSAMGSSSKK